MSKTHNEILAEIKDFVKACMKDEDLLGFNVMLSKHPGRSHILGKIKSKSKAKYILSVDLDYFDVLQKNMIDGAIYEAIHNKPMPPEEAEDLIITKWN